MPRNYSDLSKDIPLDKDTYSNQPKTTDVNILLNRVRLDKKRVLKKRIIFSTILVFLVSSLAIFFIV